MFTFDRKTTKIRNPLALPKQIINHRLEHRMMNFKMNREKRKTRLVTFTFRCNALDSSTVKEKFYWILTINGGLQGACRLKRKSR